MSYKETNTLLYIKDVSLGYDGKPILENLNFEIKDIVRDDTTPTGQMIAILGRSGRGKSTFFKAMTGLLKPTAGEMWITNLETEAEDDAKLIGQGDIGFVDQKYTLFRHKTVTQICNYALRKNKAPQAEKDAIINEYLTTWGLLEHKDKYPNELSGGQRQRTAIIEQMLTSKHFMIFDEPFSGLDVGNIEKVKESFNRIMLADELNTILFSTHDIRLAVELADNIYVIGLPEPDAKVSTIVKHYDLKQMGLAWQPYGTGHRQLHAELKELLLQV
jgi:polar amino acid transport system ATP-binding protein